MDRTADASISFQQLAGAAERLAERQASGLSLQDWLGHIEDARDRLAREPFVALPLIAYRTVTGTKERVVTIVQPPDRLVEECLLPSLHARLESLLPPAVHGFRPGRSPLTAAQAAAGILAAGGRFVALLDIASFFPSIDRELLGAAVRGNLDLPIRLREVLLALFAAPMRLDGTLQATEGLPLGRPTSPLLANLYLAGLDRVVCTALQGIAGAGYLRYGDDIFLAGPTDANRAAAETLVREQLALLRLTVREEKVKRIEFDGTPFPYLGHLVDARGLFERVPESRIGKRKRTAQAPGQPAYENHPNVRAQTLYVTEPHVYLVAREGMVRALRGKELLGEVPLHRIDRVLVLSSAAVSSGFLSACISRGIPVLFFVGRGRAYGSLVAGGMPNPVRLRAQYDLLARPDRRLALARQILDAKFGGMLARLSPAAAEQKTEIESLRMRLPGAPDIATLMGLEGAATKAYFGGFARRIRRSEFAFTERSRRPPRDPVNSLLSFAYSLIFGEMQTALLAHGLDPHPGLVHELRRGHPALASDLIEPYRPLIADSFVLLLINGGIMHPADFETRSGACYLNADGRRRFLHVYERQMNRRQGAAPGPRQMLLGAAHAMLQVVLGETPGLNLPLKPDELSEDQRFLDLTPDPVVPQSVKPEAPADDVLETKDDRTDGE